MLLVRQWTWDRQFTENLTQFRAGNIWNKTKTTWCERNQFLSKPDPFFRSWFKNLDKLCHVFVGLKNEAKSGNYIISLVLSKTVLILDSTQLETLYFAIVLVEGTVLPYCTVWRGDRGYMQGGRHLKKLDDKTFVSYLSFWNVCYFCMSFFYTNLEMLHNVFYVIWLIACLIYAN